MLQVRRGADRAEIYSLAFSANNQWLAVSSDKGTIHVFNLKIDQGSVGSDKLPVSPDPNAATPTVTSSLSFIKGNLQNFQWLQRSSRLLVSIHSVKLNSVQINTHLAPIVFCFMCTCKFSYCCIAFCILLMYIWEDIRSENHWTTWVKCQWILSVLCTNEVIFKYYVPRRRASSWPYSTVAISTCQVIDYLNQQKISCVCMDFSRAVTFSIHVAKCVFFPTRMSCTIASWRVLWRKENTRLTTT